ncbi:MAG TPA: DUF3592 domain-containing protein [Trebonia sp.]
MSAALPATAAVVWFGIEAAAFGAFVLVIGLAIALWFRRFKRQAVRAEGTIVGHVSSLGDNGGQSSADPTVTYYPIVEFTTWDGALVRGRSRIGSDPLCGQAGEAVTVFYHPRDPTRVLIETPRSRARSGCAVSAFAILGGVPLALGIGMLISVVA